MEDLCKLLVYFLVGGSFHLQSHVTLICYVDVACCMSVANNIMPTETFHAHYIYDNTAKETQIILYLTLSSKQTSYPSQNDT